MESTLEHSEGLSRRLRVTVPANDIDTAVTARVKQLGSNAKVPGFRPGKAPMKVLEGRYADAARAEVIEAKLSQSYTKAISEQELKPAGYPTFDLVSEAAGSDLEYTATFDVFPEIELAKLDTLSLERPQTDVTDDDVERTLDTIRKQNRDWTPVERAAADGDQIKIDFVGKLDGEAFEGGSGEGVEIVLGEGQFIESLESKLIGMEPGAQDTVDVTFPDDYRAEDLAGKDTTFDVTLHEVREGTAPPLDSAELLEKIGVAPDAGEAGLRAKVRESLEGERDKAVNNQTKGAVMDALLTANPIDVPGALVADEIKQLRQDAMQRFPSIADDPAAAEQVFPDEVFEGQARKRAALGLLVSETIKTADIKLEDDDVEAALKRLAAATPQPEQAEAYYRGNQQLMQQIRAVAMEDKLVQTVLENAKVKTVQTSFEVLVSKEGEQPG